MTAGSRAPSGAAVRTEGQRLLLELDASHRALGRALGVAHQSIAAWRAGSALPRPEHRRALEAAHGIPARAWSRKPGELDRKPDKRARRATPANATTDPGELLEAVRRARREPGISASELARLAGVEVRLLENRSDAEKLVDTEAWNAMVDFLLTTIGRHALAADDLLLAILRLEKSPRLPAIEAAVERERAKHRELVAAYQRANAALVDLTFWRLQ